MEIENVNPEDIFHKALEIEDKTERAIYLDQTCGRNVKLRKEVESLLKAHEQAGDFLKTLPNDPKVTLDSSPTHEGPGTVIGRYKLLEKIGEGGMATVYMAEQEKPVHRRVAMKIIKLGMDSRSVVARFEAERQALAMMDHPNIAKVFDAGITESGRPYFVMELVRGIAITEYCDKNKLSTANRLELFIQVCQAVQHAHQKGIIHRDIKPSNVMVTLHDGRPQAVVIDFGIAKATSQKLTEKTLFTRYAQLIGTPEYMSPEQAEMARLDIDTRSDIYSLGVLLYELLTGSTPFSGEQLREAGYAGIQRIICETEPQKPSTKLSTLGQTLNDVALHRSTTAHVLPKLVRGDLDWIVMKAMEKDRTRRYETTHALVQDIERHLSNKPIAAGPPRTLDRYRKFVRRNRALVTSAAVVAIVLLAGVVVSMRFAIGQSKALSRYRVMYEFLDKYVFGSLDPWRDGGRDVQIAEVLETASRKVHDSVSDPLVEASIHGILGATYLRIGKYEEAEPHLLRSFDLNRKLLGDRNSATLAAKLELGKLRFFSGHEPEAEPILDEVLSDSLKALGTRHKMTIEAMSYLATIHLHARELDKAAELGEEALKLSEDVFERDEELSLTGMLVLGTIRAAQGRFEEAEKLLTEGLDIAQGVRVPNVPNVVHFKSNLASVYLRRDKLDKAVILSQEALDMASTTLEKANYGTLTAMCTRAHVYWIQHDYDNALSLLLEARNIYKQQKSTARYWLNPEGELGKFYFQLGHYEEAESCLRNVRDEIFAKWGTRANWPFYTWLLYSTEQQLGQYEEGGKVLSELVEAVKENHVDISAFDTVQPIRQVAWVLATSWRPELRDGNKAVKWADKAYDLSEQKDIIFKETQAAAYAEAGDFETAIKYLNLARDMLGDNVPDAVNIYFEMRLELYKKGQPYREPQSPANIN